MIWLTVLGALGLLLLGLLLLCVRLQLVFTPDTRLARLTLGRRTGFEADLIDYRGTVRVAGIPVYRMNLRKEPQEAPPPPQPEAGEEPLAKPHLSPRERFGAIKEILPQALRALWSYLKGLYRATRVEELTARIEAGFDSPDQTGSAFGFYQAALGAAPAIASRIQFVPVWVGPAFTASGRITVAIPLYRLLWRTVILLWQFPTRKLIRGLR